MIDIKNMSLLDILPDSITSDRELSVMCLALDRELQSITASINEIIMLPKIDELPEDIIDSLAWQLHVDFYEPLGLDLNKKRALVKNSLSWHRRKGTKSVLNEIISILFLNDFKIEEWYEYDGSPYFFRLIVNDIIDSEQKYNDLIRAIFELKNVRSWLEKIILYRESHCHIYLGHLTRQRKKFTIDTPVPIQNISFNIKTGTRINHIRHFTIPAFIEKSLVDAIKIGIGYVTKNTHKFTIGASLLEGDGEYGSI